MTGPTPQEQAGRVLADAWAAFKASPKAGDPFAWQAAALESARLLQPPAGETTAAEALRELRVLTTCRCEQAWTGRGLHAPDCLEDWRADVETLAAALAERNAVDASLGGDTDWDREHHRICADTARDGNYVAICNLPPGHLAEPHNDEWHQESGGLTWRRHGDRIVEFR
jgi:hypothetical protein